MRPALLLLAAEAVGTVRREHIVLSAVVEMIHIATLVHDDILDEAETRRHQQTIHRRWNSESSVLLGDYLFTHAFYLASTLDTTYGCQTIGRATNRVCEGELRQVGNRGNLDLTEHEYLAIVRGKTAELCGCATHLGAYYAGGDVDQCRRMEAFGIHLGIAFQIADDLLDLTGTEDRTGKSLGSDLEKQKLTLPAIRLLDQAEGEDRNLARQCLSSPPTPSTIQSLQQLLQRYDCLAYAQQTARTYASDAVEELAGFSDSPSLETLRWLAEFTVSRSH